MGIKWGYLLITHMITSVSWFISIWLHHKAPLLLSPGTIDYGLYAMVYLCIYGLGNDDYSPIALDIKHHKLYRFFLAKCPSSAVILWYFPVKRDTLRQIIVSPDGMTDKWKGPINLQQPIPAGQYHTISGALSPSSHNLDCYTALLYK